MDNSTRTTITVRWIYKKNDKQIKHTKHFDDDDDDTVDDDTSDDDDQMMIFNLIKISNCLLLE